VSDGTIVTFDEEVDASATVPGHVWAAAWALVLDFARRKAEKMTRDKILGLAEYIDLFAQAKVPARNRIQIVTIDNQDDEDIQVRACPYDLLRYYATVSASDSHIGE
jgi:hypothetical protein